MDSKRNLGAARLGLSLAFLLVAASSARADDPGARGPYATRAHSFSVALRTGGTASIDVRLPAAGSFARPIVLIAHGWIVTAGIYSGNAEHLASRGFAAVLVQQPNGFSSDTSSWANVLSDVITGLDKLNRQSSSPLFGELDLARVGATGHSRGGAAVTWLAGTDPRVKAVAALAPVNQYTYYQTVDTVKKTTAAYLAVTGDSDWLCPLLYPRGYYGAATRAVARQEIEIRGGGHMAFVGTDEVGTRYYTAWFERFLMGKADPDGWTTGAKAQKQKQAGTLSSIQFATSTGAPAPTPTPVPQPQPTGSTLQMGSTGQAVKDLQAKLKSVGFDPGPADGDFGPKTEKAVKDFQSSKGLASDGVVGPQTRAALGL